MPVSTIRAKYDELESVAQAFDNLSIRTQTTTRNLTDARNGLNGEWVGFGAERFFGEMESDIIPSMQKLENALAHVANLIREISYKFAETEEATAQSISGLETGASAFVAQPLSMPNAPINNSEPFDEDAANERYREVFTDEYMDDLVGTIVPGSENERLNQLMEQLMLNPNLPDAELNKMLTEMAKIRGVDAGEFIDQYQTYLSLKDEAANYSEYGYTPVDIHKHPEFLGSTASLRYGMVAGEILGIDPIFGALLNPTGGLVGAGNDSFEPGDNDAIGYHGIVHDVAGYVLNYHNIGEGYEYLDHQGVLDLSLIHI